jgi:hypothetical protein
VRFDTVLTFKLTPASIGAALSLGLTAPTILAALDRVGRHPVPDNVRLMIGDWARSIRTASLRKAWVIETNGPEAADAAARALGGHLLARPTPTTLLVDEALTSPAAILGKGGVHVDAQITRSPRSKRSGSIASAPLTIPTPSPALRTRFAAERSSKNGLSIPSATPVASRALAPVRGPRLPESLSEIADLDAFLPDIGDGDETAPSDVLGALLEQVDDPGAYEVIDRLADRWVDLEDVIINWASRRGGRIGDDALERASREPWAFLPLVVMNASAQRRIVRDARSTDEMITRARKLVEEGVAVEEPELFERASSPEVQRLFGVESKADAAPASDSPSSIVGEQRVQGSEAIHDAFTRAIERGASVMLRVHSKTQGERRLHLRPERVLTRGADVTLLGTELGTGLGRSFPLANV